MCLFGVLINLLKVHCKNSITVSSTQKSCIVYIRACVEQNYPAAKCGKSGDNTAPTHRRLLRCTYLGTIVVEDGPAWRVLDDELDQLHRRIGQATDGFHKEDGKVIRVPRGWADTELLPCLRSGFAGPRRRQQ